MKNPDLNDKIDLLMEQTKDLQISITDSVTAVKAGYGASLARLVSYLFTPPLLGLVGIILVGQAIGTPTGWRWSIFFILANSLPPLSYIFWKLHTAEITDFHIQLREQRMKPLIVTLISAIVAFVVMTLGRGPVVLRIFALAWVFQASFILGITNWWKISGHASGIMNLVIFLWIVYGSVIAPMFIAVPLVGWARLRLRRHSLAQVLIGTLAGAIFMLGTLMVFNQICGGINFRCPN
jgi:membrane-associated phospholipid phosphatase